MKRPLPRDMLSGKTPSRESPPDDARPAGAEPLDAEPLDVEPRDVSGKSVSFVERPPSGDACSIIAPARWDRPIELRDDRPIDEAAGTCPFCRGREESTPPGLAEYGGSAREGDWLVRVVPNKYPVAVAAKPPGTDVPSSASVHGAHEVIVESPHHVVEWTELDVPQIERVIGAWCDRLTAAARSWRFASLFKNNGHRAGASLSHVHSQLIAVDFVPPAVATRESWLAQYYAEHHECWLCARSSSSPTGSGRLIEAVNGETFALVVPAFSAMAGETWLVPVRHACHFHEMDGAVRSELARRLPATIATLRSIAGPFAYNLVVQTPSFGVSSEAPFHWYMRIIPRIVVLGGFEWSTECYINPLDPYRLAEDLRRRLGD